MYRFSKVVSKINIFGFPVRFSHRFKGHDFKRVEGEVTLFIDNMVNF